MRRRAQEGSARGQRALCLRWVIVLLAPLRPYCLPICRKRNRAWAGVPEQAAARPTCLGNRARPPT
eukprot:8699205-Alexandrium_andersonii.AAC.1